MTIWRGARRNRGMALTIWGILALILALDTYGIKLKPGGQRFGREVFYAGPGRQKQEKPAEDKTIALTFDDGPHPKYTPRLLAGLKERGVRATFFLIGQNIDGNEDIIRQMDEDGHLIGNHSQKHMQLTREQAKEACEQINRTNEKIREITGETPEYVRPPYGSWSEELECMVPMKVALWNLDPLDWKTQNKDRIVRHIVSHVEDGSIVLLHDVYDASVEAALEVVDILSAKGYHFVTVDELLIE